MRTLLAVVFILVPTLSPSTGHAQVSHHFTLLLHVATGEDGAPIADDDGLERWVAEASAHYAPAEVAFDMERASDLPSGLAVLERNRDRHRLRRYVREHRINVFVVSQILDPVASAATRRAADQAGHALTGRLGGAHIPMRGRSPETYIIVTFPSRSSSLAHELGHFFGAPHHADASNIMSYGRDRHDFDARQIRAFRRNARRYRRRRILR